MAQNNQSAFAMGAQAMLSDPFQAAGGKQNNAPGDQGFQSAFGNSEMNQFAAQMVGNLVKNRVEDVVNDNKGWLNLDMFKDYFDVTNVYVLHKLRIIFFPFTVKGEDGWKPKNRDFDSSPNLGSHDMDEARDLQAADLYIPLMSFVTFILLNGCQMGLNDTFDMESLTYIYSKSLFLWIFEAICQKGLFWFFNFGHPSFLELLAFCGYKFVVLCPIVTTDMLIGYGASYVLLFLLAALFALFFFQTMRRYATANTLADHIKEVSLNRKTFMLGNSITQIALIWLLSYN